MSPLSTRDLNRKPSRKHEDYNNIQNRQDEAICFEKIKERFDRDFLPKYGHLWRRIIREKERKAIESDNDILVDVFVEPTLLNPRALNFLEAIERKQAVSISTVQECKCAPPIVEFVDLEKEQTKHITMDRKKRRSYDSQNIPSEPNNNFEAVRHSTECSKTTTYEETKTGVDEEDIQSVYETADEFEDECDGLKDDKIAALIEEKARSIATEKTEYRGNEQNEESNSNTVVIDIDSDSEDMKDDTSTVANLRSETTTLIRNHNHDDKGRSFGFDASKLHISAKDKEGNDRTVDPIIDAQKTACLSPRLIEETTSSGGYNTSIDTDNEADDEYATESEDEAEEAEWIPDDESIHLSPKSNPQPKKVIGKRKVEKRITNWNPSQKSKPKSKQSIEKRKVEKRITDQKPSQKSKPQPKQNIEKRKVEKRMINHTIDLCDTSSSDDAVDSDFTVTTHDDKSFDTKEQIAPAIASKKQGKGRSTASFRRNREQITTSTLNEFNQNAFGGKLGKVVVQWSKKLNTTAGLTRLQKLSTDMTPGMPLKRLATIELSTKVVDDEDKLRTTLLHELVHAAVWIFDGVSRPPHGSDFKRWAKIAMSKIPDVIVTTTHSYQIQYKFNWACVIPNCSFTIGRHSKSVDIIRHRCGKCRGKLIEVTADGAPKKRAQPSAYNLFIKQHSKAVREQLVKRKSGVTQADVMKELGRLWREQKGRSTSRSADL